MKKNLKALLGIMLVITVVVTSNSFIYAKNINMSKSQILAAKQLSERTGRGLSKNKIMRQQKEFERITNYKEVLSMNENNPAYPKKFAEYIDKYNEYCDKIGQSNNKVEPLSDNPTLKEVQNYPINIGSGGDDTYSGDGNSFSVSALESGEIVLPDLYGVCIQGLINHAAIYDESRYYDNSSACFLSANNDDNQNGLGYSYVGVGYESPDYYRDAFDQVHCCYVKNHDSDEQSALDKAQAEANVGEDYSLKTLKSNTSKWYCSKVVWYGYKHGADVDIDYDGGPFVFPVDIYNDGDIVVWKTYE
ncbi:hypothetical protein [Vallitalea maricola]|uniref:Uncharacterized protein n=1 Tax=Vallitalea maricola TaxID=3074433 RepID=A0ACB5ULV3_9FIRM|nr:hypothetical protein AN2V17_28290 [Vallitalea sp. AN17-2]